MSIAEISARIAQIERPTVSRPAAVARFAGPSFASTLAALAPRLDATALGTAPSPVLGTAEPGYLLSFHASTTSPFPHGGSGGAEPARVSRWRGRPAAP